MQAQSVLLQDTRLAAVLIGLLRAYKTCRQPVVESAAAVASSLAQSSTGASLLHRSGLTLNLATKLLTNSNSQVANSGSKVCLIQREISPSICVALITGGFRPAEKVNLDTVQIAINEGTADMLTVGIRLDTEERRTKSCRDRNPDSIVW